MDQALYYRHSKDLFPHGTLYKLPPFVFYLTNVYHFYLFLNMQQTQKLEKFSLYVNNC